LWSKLKGFSYQKVGGVDPETTGDALYPIDREAAHTFFESLDLLAGRGRLAPLSEVRTRPSALFAHGLNILSDSIR
jgi:hypothetical protein